MDIVCSFWGALLWLLAGSIGGWIIHSIFHGHKITELSDALMDRDSRLMGISRDHKNILAEQEKRNLSLKSELTHLERSNTDLNTHNFDLRSTIDTLRKSQEEHLAILFEPQNETEESDETHEIVSANLQLSKSNPPSPNKAEKSSIKGKQKLERTRKKLKKATKYALKLEERLIKLTRALKEKVKAKTIVKEVPIIIRQEVQIKERIDKKKLEKLFGFKVPTIKSKKTVQVSKKKGKPVIIKK